MRSPIKRNSRTDNGTIGVSSCQHVGSVNARRYGCTNQQNVVHGPTYRKCKQRRSCRKSPPQPTANAAVQDTVQLEILRILRVMQQDMNHRDTNQDGKRGYGHQNNGDKGGRADNSQRRNWNQKTQDDTSFTRCVTKKYYWTYGGCNHASGEYTSKAQNHKDVATIENCMGWYNDFCPAIPCRKGMELDSNKSKFNVVLNKIKDYTNSSFLVSPDHAHDSSLANNAKGDNAASHPYWCEQDKFCLQNII